MPNDNDGHLGCLLSFEASMRASFRTMTALILHKTAKASNAHTQKRN